MLKYWNFFLSEEEAADELEQPVSGLGHLTLKPCTLEQSRQWRGREVVEGRGTHWQTEGSRRLE